MVCQPSAQHHVEHHHEHETERKANGAVVAVLARRCFGNEFFYDDVDHGASGKCKHVGQYGQKP